MLKLLKAEIVNEQIFAGVISEARILAGLSHPNVVRVFEANFSMMESMKGITRPWNSSQAKAYQVWLKEKSSGLRSGHGDTEGLPCWTILRT